MGTNPVRVLRTSYFRLSGSEFLQAVARAVLASPDEKDLQATTRAGSTPLQRGVVGWTRLEQEVANGGLTQFFYNTRDEYVDPLLELFATCGAKEMELLLRDAARVYHRHRARFEVTDPFGGELFGQIEALEKLDRRFLRLSGKTAKLLEAFLRSGAHEIFVGDDGQPILPTFTGVIETTYPNGRPYERCTARKGKLAGPYTRYREDGSVEATEFFAKGRVSSDHWPDGRVRRKERKEGRRRVIEWFYESGQLQKRLETEGHRHPVAPIRLWHPNGVLAEELHYEEGKKRGSWLRFFDDGSPRLVARHDEDETLVVEHAWDDARRQIVVNGTGRYVEDARSISVEYDVSRNRSLTSEVDLVEGIRHGEVVSFLNGVAWSRSQFAHGLTHGESVEFYDTGRLRSRSVFDRGRLVSRQEFRKFDFPRPVVRLVFECSERLYDGWKRPRLHEYAMAENLVELEARLEVPQMLVEVFARNYTGMLRSDYENIDTFNDGISYVVELDPAGVPIAVEAGGSGIYSGGLWEVYPPILRDLRCRPSRDQGRPVASTAIVRVEHTFEETAPAGTPRDAAPPAASNARRVT